MISWGSDTGFEYSVFGTIIVAGFVSFFFWRNRTRRRTLRIREDGMYVWIEWPSGERCSPDDPSAPGGEWDSGGDGDGGDGGGD